MKYFAGVGGVNRLLNEASLPGRVMKISDEEENHCIMTCGGTFTHARAHAHAHVWTASIVADFHSPCATLTLLPHQ